jgi:hypothetical protein
MAAKLIALAVLAIRRSRHFRHFLADRTSSSRAAS